MAPRPSKLIMLGYYVQMLASFLLIALTHYFTAAFLPIADCDETYNFVEPAHYLLYGRGKQTWENCPQYALRSWLFVWLYAWPAALVRSASSLASVDVYFYLRIFNGRLVGVTQLYLVYSVWAAFSGKMAMVTLLVLLLNYPIPHAAVSVLPTSFVMSCYFVALGSWLRTAIPCEKATHGQANATALKTHPVNSAAASVFYPTTITKRSQRIAIATTVFFVVLAGVLGWPFAGLVAVPIGLDLLIRFPRESCVCLVLSLLVAVGASIAVDSLYYCKPVLVAWNIVKYNVFGGEARGPELYGTEPWFYFFKNLLLNFHILFLAALVSPAVVLLRKSRQHTPAEASVIVTTTRTRGRQLLFTSPFFLWFSFWLFVAHKEERFMSPAYPFLVFAAALTITHIFFPDRGTHTPAAAARTRAHSRGREAAASPSVKPASRRSVRCRRFVCMSGVCLLLLFGLVSFSRAMAIYHFYSGPERALYDWYLALQHEAKAKVEKTGQRYQLCVGKEWYRFPSSFFLDSRYADYQFLKTASFSGMLPVSFPPTTPQWKLGLLATNTSVSAESTTTTTALGTCRCGAAGMNDLNQAIPEQYMDVAACDAVFDSVLTAEEADEIHLDAFPQSIFTSDVLRAIATTGGDDVAQSPYRGLFYHPRDEAAYRLLDVDHTPMWCRVLFYPFGITDRCAQWRTIRFQARHLYTTAPPGGD